MRQKFITALSLVVVFAIVFSSQLSTTASAHAKPSKPVTSPVTIPVTFFKVTGNITYKFFNFFKHSAQRFAPASGVTVTAENVFTREKVSTTTDGNGNYTLGLKEKGVYLVTPTGGQTSTYVKPLEVIKAQKSGSKTNVNFTGLMLP